MTIWEYKLELMESGGHLDVEKGLNSLGEKGWELVGTETIGDHEFLILKRPVEIAEEE